MAAMFAVGLLPYLPVCNRIEPRATASNCPVAMCPFAGGFGQSDNVVVSIFVGVDGNAEKPEENRDQNIQKLFHDMGTLDSCRAQLLIND